MEGYPNTVQGCKVMKLKFSEESKGAHHILWKRHNVRVYSELKPPERTLFVVNVPPYCTESNFKNIFLEYGDVETVYFCKKPSDSTERPPKYPNFSFINAVKGFKGAYVVFSKAASLKRAMEASPSKELVLSTADHQVTTGLQKWHQEYNRQFVSPEELTEEIKTVMSDYDKEKEESQEVAKEEDEPDEDGWVTVTSVKKKKPKLLKASEFKRQTKRKKKKQTELVKFYAFQQRQTKIDKLAQLRKRFEEDKKRINMMKASRKFRP